MEPNSILCQAGISSLSTSLLQNMTIRPRVKQAMKVIKPKINKNRLWSDFCLKSSLSRIDLIDLLAAMQSSQAPGIVHEPDGRFEYLVSI